MKNLKVIAARLKRKFFPTEDDKKWKQWVDFKYRDTGDLIELLSSDVEDSFKRRALYLLIVPSADFNTFYWKQGISFRRIDFLTKLATDQLNYVANLIIEFCSILRPIHTGKTKLSITNGGNMTVYVSVVKFYNTCILQLLDLLPEEKAKELFQFFWLLGIFTNDILIISPFKDLMSDQNINEKWKKAADIRMREIIRSEIAGEIKPREEYGGAINEYAIFVQQMFFLNVKYSVEIYASQIQFIIDNSRDKKDLIDYGDIMKMFNFFSADKYKELRYALAKYVLDKDNDGFSNFLIYDDETNEIDYILKEFGDDKEFIDKIKKIKKERRQKEPEKAAYKATQKAYEKEQKVAEEKIMAQMKRAI